MQNRHLLLHRFNSLRDIPVHHVPDRISRLTHCLEQPSELRWLLLLAVIALAMRGSWEAFAIDRQPRFDEVEYVRQAQQLCERQGYVDKAGNPTKFWPIGFPLVLATAFCIFGVPSTGVGLQVVIGTLICVMVSSFGERIDPL